MAPSMTAALTFVAAALMVLATTAFAPLHSSSLTAARRPMAARRSLTAVRMSGEEQANNKLEEASDAIAQVTEPEPDAEDKGEVSPKVGQQGFFQPNSNLRYGTSRDQDGKSNVWAVEPKMKVDDGENKGSNLAVGGAILAVCGALVIATLANLPALDTY